MSCNEIETPMLNNNLVYDVVDYKGRPVLRSTSGCWISAYYLIGYEVAEKFAFQGISSNLITYLTGPLGQSTATAAANVNMWSGMVSLLPLLGAFIADVYLGQYLTIIVASILYVLALGLLSFSTLISSDTEKVIGASSSSTTQIQVIIFFVSLYIWAFALGGYKPCLQAFGVAQFDADNPVECKAKSSFFNWWYFGSYAGPIVGILVLNYVQDNLSWGLGFGIPCIIMLFAFMVFLLGTFTYRFAKKTEDRSALVRIGQVFGNTLRNCQKPSDISALEEASGTLPSQDPQQFRFLNKPLLSPADGSNEVETFHSKDEVHEAKSVVIRLIPIWVTCLAYAIMHSQTFTLFTKQGATMDRFIGSSFELSAATLQCFIGLSVIIVIPIYDKIFVPLTRAITKRPSGITMLQRIGTGILISIVCMVVAAITETKRLKVASEYGLVDKPDAVVPMKIWWLLPQYLLSGASEVFTIVGIQEFFYDQMPSDLRSMGLALYLSIFGIGNFLSSFLIFIVEKTTGGNGQDGWISDNMNHGHIDYFYYLLAGMSSVAFLVYIYVAKAYVYNQEKASDVTE